MCSPGCAPFIGNRHKWCAGSGAHPTDCGKICCEDICLIWACISCSFIACEVGENPTIIWDVLTMSTEAKSCILFDEGCGESEQLFAPKLDPNCRIERSGEEVVISGTFAAGKNVLSDTYIPWPADAWKLAVATQYGYVVFESVEDNR